MPSHQMNVVLFGDSIPDLYATLQRLNGHKRNHPFLGMFLERVDAAIREEVGAQPRSIREQIPVFTTVFALAEQFHKQDVPNSAVSSTLLCVCQLALFIDYFEEHPNVQFNQESTCVIGLGVGLLSAAAIASSQTLINLLSIAVETVRIAFRTGVTTDRVSRQTQEHKSSHLSWSMNISDVSAPTVANELDSFYEVNKTPLSSKAYISAVSKGTVTISGPPTRLKQLVQDSEFFRLSKIVNVPTYGLYHAAHLYRKSDVTEILQFDSANILRSARPTRTFLSTVAEKGLVASNAYDLFAKTLVELLVRPLYWDQILCGAVSHLRDSEVSKCRISTFGTSHASKGLIATLRIKTEVEVVSEDLAHLDMEPQKEAHTLDRPSTAKIAIVGMSGRFPGANDCEALWDLLEQGLDVHRQIPKDRFNVETHYDQAGKKVNTSHTPYGCFIEQPGHFDARFFSMSPREAAQTDPMHRMAILTAYEALEMSGFVPNRTPSTKSSRVGTFYGQTSDDWREVNIAQKIDTFFIPGGVRAFAPGRINYNFKLSGPSYSIDTACSSSLAAVQIACSSLWNGECDTAIAGGLNILTAPDIFAGLSRGQFLSKTGSCKTFDASADGYCRADGAGTVILKKLADAEADKDNILGVILGTATNHSAEAISITHPHAGAQANLYESVLNNAAMNAQDISYVEMHGTGTQAGDKTEMKSVLDTFAPRTRVRGPNQPLHLGALKSNIGHSEAAAGISALIKMLMMLKKNAIPPHVGIKTKINPALPQDLEAQNVHISLERVPWLPVEGRKRVAFLNNFSAAGGNTALLLEDPPQRAVKTEKDPRSTHVVAVSGKSISSIKANIQQLASYIEENPNVSLPDLSYTTCARRIHHNYRAAVVSNGVDGVKNKLVASLDQQFSPIPSQVPGVAFVFTGQGAYYSSLGRQLYEESTQFRSKVEGLNSIAVSEGFPSFLPAITGEIQDASLLSPLVVQLALVCVQIALGSLWISWGVRPTTVIGHSLGEYAALNAAGVLSTVDAIFLVGHRAKLLQERCSQGTHAMLSVKGSLSSIESASAGKPFELACVNGKKDTVVVGTVQEMDSLAETLKLAELKSMKLDLPFAFHSSQVDPILDSFRETAKGLTFNAPKIPVMSPLLGKAISEAGHFNAEYLCQHAREPVNFLSALDAAGANKLVDEKTAWVEIGGHPICSNMIRSSRPGVGMIAPSLRRDEDPWKTLAESQRYLYCAGIDIDWSEVGREFEEARQLLTLPSYCFDYKNYWIDYENDWCLTKGAPSKMPSKQLSSASPEPVSEFSTTTVHRIIEENFSKPGGRVVAQSNVNGALLHAAISGHLVNGAGLCPSSIYADMAYTLANYMVQHLKPESSKINMDVCDMEVVKPLIAKKNPTDPQIIQMTAVADLGKARATIRFASVNALGKETVQHATCTVKYEESERWLSEWAQIAYMVKGRINTLQKGVDNGISQRITRGLAYKLFSSLVQYGNAFRGMEEVILDSLNLEATSRVSFQTSEKNGNFFCSPFWIDSLAHLSGFVMNGSEATDSKNFVYVSHGWKYMRFAKALSAETKYRSYVKMQEAGTNVVAGDIYVLEEDTIVGVVGGLKFQRIPRSILDTLLPADGSSKAEEKVPQKSRALPVSTQITSNPSLKSHAPKARTLTPSVPSKENKSTAQSLIRRALDIISHEAEIEHSELQESCVFADIGIDSLLSLTIAGRFREELGLDVPGSIFLDCPTIGSLQQLLLSSTGSSVSSDDTPTYSEPSESDLESVGSSIETDSSSDSDGFEMLATPNSDDERYLDLIRSTISNQMGLPLEEISSSVDLGSLGMDSLMTISILGSLREETGLTLSSDFFVNHPTMNDVEKYLCQQQPKNSGIHTRETAQPAKRAPPAVSILLQGDPKTAERTIFLFPDGSGSATSYAAIPEISSKVCAFGLNCPYMTTPEAYTCGIEEVSKLYIAEVKRRQPKGPYFLGGWSAGGVIGYEVTQQLLQAGDKVERLILFDSPCPVRLEALPSRLHHFFNSIGLLGTGSKKGPPNWLLPHFEAAIKGLSEYKAKPMDAKHAPKTFAIWAQDGVCKNPTDPRPPPSVDDPKSMKWLLNNRTDFGYNGWDELLGAENITTTSISANHFTMMREPIVRSLGALIKKGLE